MSGAPAARAATLAAAMDSTLVVSLELLQIVLPALIVYLTATRLLGDHLRVQERVLYARHRSEVRSATLPVQLRAYERLSIFCERIAIANLLLRLQESGQSAGELKVTLFLAIQQEYEHNASQQVYMSEQLWSIIRQARDNTVQAIDSVSDIVEPQLPGRELARALLAQAAPGSDRSLALALAAIKKEAARVLD